MQCNAAIAFVHCQTYMPTISHREKISYRQYDPLHGSSSRLWRFQRVSFKPILLLLVYASRAITGSQAMASSSAECSWDKPPFNFIREQELTMWDIACFSPQGHKSVAAWFHNFLQTPHWPCAGRKWLIREHYCRGRLKPGCRIVESSTREKLTTQGDLQFSFH